MKVAELDLRAIIRLLGGIAELRCGFERKRQHVLDGLCDLIDACEWIVAQYETKTRRCLSAIRRPGPMTKRGIKSIPAPRVSELVPNWRSSGRVLLATRDLGEETKSCIALMRAADQHIFTDRERQLARIVLTGLPWLHAGDEIVFPLHQTPPLKLSPAKSKVLQHLLIGRSRKEVATMLGMSEGTVSGYARDIYRHFHVSSQAELMLIATRRFLQRINSPTTDHPLP